MCVGWLCKEMNVCTAVCVSQFGWLESLRHDVREVLEKGAMQYDVGPHRVAWVEWLAQVSPWVL